MWIFTFDQLDFLVHRFIDAIFMTSLLCLLNSFTSFAERNPGSMRKNGGSDTIMRFLLALTLEIRNVQSTHIPEFQAYTFWLIFNMLSLLMDT